MKVERRREPRRERVLPGIGVSAGIGVGPAHLVESGRVEVAERRLVAREVAGECARFERAVAAAGAEVASLIERARHLPAAARDELVFLLEAHGHMLAGSRLVRGVEARIAGDRVNAEAAVKAEVKEIADAFAGMQDPYLAGRGQDVSEVAQRLLRHLTDSPGRSFSELPDGAVLIAEELTPADIALLDPGRVAGLATELGGPQGHTSIMARSLGLPAVVGIAGLTRRVRAGATVVVDGTRGAVILGAAAPTVARARRRRTALRRQRKRLARLRDLPAETRDHVTVRLQANIELPAELDMAIDAGADGIGLLRTELMYMNRDTPPDADEQYETLRGIVTAMHGRPVTMRTLDIGGDKLAHSVEAGTGANPALGLRAIRLSLRHRKLLETQLEAMLRTSRHGPVRILLPMITVPSEMRQTRAVLRRVARHLSRQGVAMADDLPPLGAMIEIPAAALAADRLAGDCDFLSIGTNDLTMYTLAVDRGDEQVAGLYDPLHPAVLRLIQFAREAARRSRRPINLCGEIAGDPRYTALLIGLGLTDLSMAPAGLPAVKERIRAIEARAARDLADRVMRLSEARRIAAVIDAFNEAL